MTAALAPVSGTLSPFEAPAAQVFHADRPAQRFRAPCARDALCSPQSVMHLDFSLSMGS